MKASFIDLCRTALEVVKSFRLGKATPNKIRPLLINTANVDTKMNVLKSAHCLRLITKFNNIYVSPDRTRQKRESFRKLRVELKQRKEGGEPNLIIRNGRIVTKQSTT